MAAGNFRKKSCIRVEIDRSRAQDNDLQNVIYHKRGKEIEDVVEDNLIIKYVL